jgi:WD40 repeat protein
MFIDIHSKAIRDAIWSNSEAEIVSVSYDESCALTDIETGKEKARLRHNQLLTTICNNLTDENIKLIGSKNEILSWDTRTPNPCKIYKTQMGQVNFRIFKYCRSIII